MTTPVTPIPAAVTVEEFNRVAAVDTAALVDRLAELFASRTLAAALVDLRPFVTVDALCATASVLLQEQDEAEILESVNAHPPIGGAVAAGSLSAAEQTAATEQGTDGGELHAIRNLQPTYRDKFGWNFLIRAAGRDSRQILDNLVERLAHEPEDEWPVVVDNLDAINQVRLRGFVSGVERGEDEA